MIGAPRRSANWVSSSVALSAPRPARIAVFLPAFRISAARRKSSLEGNPARRAKAAVL